MQDGTAVWEMVSSCMMIQVWEMRIREAETGAV